jgi:hypothetical protein
MPRIMFDSCDVLIVDEIGKNISGEGMDPNITGTYATPYVSGPFNPQRVCVLGLTKETLGNAFGAGIADACSMRLYKQADFSIAYPNSITSTVLRPCYVPLVMANDRETIQLCLHTCTEIDHSRPRIIRIKNSLHIEHIQISESMLDEALKNPDIIVESDPKPLQFNKAGNLW